VNLQKKKIQSPRSKFRTNLQKKSQVRREEVLYKKKFQSPGQAKVKKGRKKENESEKGIFKTEIRNETYLQEKRNSKFQRLRRSSNYKKKYPKSEFETKDLQKKLK